MKRVTFLSENNEIVESADMAASVIIETLSEEGELISRSYGFLENSRRPVLGVSYGE